MNGRVSIFFLSAIFAGAPSVRAVEYSLENRLTQTYLNTHKDQADPVLVNRSSAQSKLRTLWYSGKRGEIETVLEPRFDWNWSSAILPEAEVRQPLAEIREGYFELSNSKHRLTLGQILVSWGSSDLLNPTDFFGASDQTRLSLDAEESRIPILGIRYRYQWIFASDNTWQTDFVIAAPPNKNRYHSKVNVATIPGAEFRGNLYDKEQVNVGVKTGYFAQDWDLSAVFFKGQSKIQELQVIEQTMTNLGLAEVHQNLEGAGLDLNIVVEKWILRAEMAYERVSLLKGLSDLKTDDQYYGVFGFERPFGDQYRFHFQYYYKHLLNYQIMDQNSLAVIDQLKSQARRHNNRLRGYMGDTDQGVFIRGSGQFFDDRLEAQIVTISSVSNVTHIVRPSLKWTSPASYILTAGSLSYIGAEDSPVGELKDASHYFFEAQYLF